MTQEYTPTTDEVRSGFRGVPIKYEYAGTWDYINENWWELNKQAFNRWLAAHDARIRADAWEEGRIAEHYEANGWGDAINPYRKEQKQ